MSNILVTGGCGFIGSNLSFELAKLGHKVTIIDNMSSSREDFFEELDNLNLKIKVVFDCFSSDVILHNIKNKNFDYIFHLAAIPRVSYSIENPYDTTKNNILLTTKLIEASVNNVKRFIFASSSSVYGGADIMPTPETCEKKYLSPYSWQKGSIEDLLKVYNSLYSFDSVCLRYFNVFGPGQQGGSAYSTAISAWCNAIKNNTPLRKDGSGEQSRDLCYVDNVVKANILAMNHSENLNANCFNVACGDRTSNNQILDKLKDKFGNLKIHQVPFRAGDVMHTQANIDKIKNTLGYSPEYRFWEGFEKTLDWWNLNEK